MGHDKIGDKEAGLRAMKERKYLAAQEAKKVADKYIADPKRSRITREKVVIGRPVFAKKSKAKRK